MWPFKREPREMTPEEWLDSVQGAIACNWQARPWGNGIYSAERANELWKWSLEEYERRKAGLPFQPPPKPHEAKP